METIENLNKRVAALELVSQGKCPTCKASIKNWQVPMGSFAPEMWATLREQGIDPANGHLLTCIEKSRRI